MEILFGKGIYQIRKAIIKELAFMVKGSALN